MCTTFDPNTGIPQTNVDPASEGQILSLTTSPLVTVSAGIGMTCSLICLFTMDNDDNSPPIQVANVALVDPDTNAPIPGFGMFRGDSGAEEAAHKLIRSIKTPFSKRRLAVFAFSARVVEKIEAGQAANLVWQAHLCGDAKQDDLIRGLKRYHAWIVGGLDGNKFDHHVSFAQIERVNEA